MYYIGWLAYCFHLGLVGLWWHVQALPWPTWPEIFKSLVVFVLLWRPRKWLETYWLGKPIHARKGKVPTTKDHQAASASITDIFTHH